MMLIRCTWFRTHIEIALVSAALGCLPCMAAEATFVVSPTGDDSNPGTQARPFASLARARDAAGGLREADSTAGDLVVLVRGGVYRLGETLLFGLDDSAPDGATTTYAAWPGERPVITSAVPLANWTKPAEPPSGLPAAAKGHVWVADVPDDLVSFNTLYDSTGRLPRAVAKGFFPDKQDKEGRPGDYTRMAASDDILALMLSGGDAAMTVAPSRPWVRNMLPVVRVDRRLGAAFTNVPSTYPLQPLSWGASHFPQGTLWIENVLGALDEPGEWVLDAKARKVYLWPRDDREPGSDVVAPSLVELVRIEGRIDYDRAADVPVTGLVFRGLTFTGTDRSTMPEDHKGKGVQHDWEMFDRSTAAVRLRGAERCTLERCRFTEIGGTALRFDLWARENRVSHSLFENIGQCAVLLAGYGPGTKNVNRLNTVDNNHIHHIGQLIAHSPAVFVWQSGENRITNNRIHNTPYTAIVVSGRVSLSRTGQGECSKTVRWHEIEDQQLKFQESYANWKIREPYLHGRQNLVALNDISYVMEQLGDGNCIYISGTGGGNVVRENYLHDVLSSPRMNAAIRCDDDQHETVIQRNVIHRCVGEGFIFKGRTVAENNIIADLRSAMPDGVESIHQRGCLVLPWGEVAGSVVRHNICYVTDPAVIVGSDGFGRRDTRAVGYFRDCEMNSNIYFHTARADWADQFLSEARSHGNETLSSTSNPLFRDPENGDFRFAPSSPAPELGISEVDLRDVAGPREPIQH